MKSILGFKKLSYFFLITTVLLVVAFPRLSIAATLLSDDFTGTTIDTSKWTETDAGGTGGTVGNVRQNGSVSLIGSTAWGQNYLNTVSTYDRANGGLEIQADMTCGVVGGVGYGDPGVLTGGGQSYTVYSASGFIFFSRQSANTNAENSTTGFSCATGVTYHLRMTVGTTTGASLYLNGSGTPILTMTGGTFTNKGFFLTGYSTTATTIDNVVISGTTTPSAPQSLTPTPAYGQMGLTWSVPSSDGGAAITDYIIEYKLATEPMVWTTFADGTSTATSAVVTGLTNDLSYNFRVSAVNSIGRGTISSTATGTPAVAVPSAPQSLLTIPASTQVSLAWSAPLTDGGATLTDYIIEYKPATEPTVWTTFADGTSTATSAVVTGLTNDLSYNFRVSAVNSVGTSSPSSTATRSPVQATLVDVFNSTTIDTTKWVEADTGGLGGTVGNVTQGETLNIVAGHASWSAQDGIRTINTYSRSNGDVSVEFNVSRTSCGTAVGSVAVGYGDFDFTTVGSSAYILLTSTTNWQLYYWADGVNQSGSPQTLSGITSCTNGVPNTFKIVALQAGGVKVYINGSGTAAATINGGTFNNKTVWFGGYQAGGTVSYDDVIIKEPLVGPLAPTGLAGVSGDGSVSLSWTSGGNNGATITDYIVEYKLNNAGSWSTFSDGTSAATTATVTGLTNGALYNFRVSAVNVNGTSGISTTANATPLSATPGAPVASSIIITGSPSVTEIVTGVYTYTDPNGNAESASTYRWLRSDTINGTYTAISGATSINYTITLADLSKYLKFEVTPGTTITPTTGTPVLSSATAQVGQINYFNQILSTGQSLSVGYAATPALSTTQPYTNKMLTGAYGGLGAGGALTPLVENAVETMSSSIANSLTFNDPGNDLDTIMSLHGVSGYTYSQLKKGTVPFSTGMVQVTNAKAAATSLGRTLRVLGVTNIHGETDNFNGVTGSTYEGYLVEWQNDYDTDVKAITGQSNEVYMFIDQLSSFMSSYANDATSEIPIYQLKASVDNPNQIVLVTPKYFFNYSDRHHLTGASSRWLGEYHAKVIKKVALDHETWRPLSPDTITRIGNVLYADFHVPAGVLAFDTTLVSSRANKGFEYYDSTSSATISSVEILDNNTVKITLSGVPTGSNQRLRYAYTGIPGTDTGAQNAGTAAGNLRDTDPYPSLYGNTLYDWAVHFDEPIVADTTAPVVTGFSIPATTTSLTVPINTFTATDNIEVAGYLINENASTPSSGDSGWVSTAPTTYVFSSSGSKTLYAWAKDTAGNISLAAINSITITLPVITSNSHSSSGKISTKPLMNTQVTSISTNASLTNSFPRVLKLKMTGSDVKKLQIYLNLHGYPVAFAGPGSHNHETNFFGPATKAALTKFQKANNLKGDGILGNITISVMK